MWAEEPTTNAARDLSGDVGDTFFYVVTAKNAEGESSESNENSAAMPAANASNSLHQLYAWQSALYNWMETVDTTDVHVDLSAITWNNSQYTNADELRRIWTAFQSTEVRKDLINAGAGNFVLDDPADTDGIDRSDTAYVYLFEAVKVFEEMVNLGLARVDFAGNPYRPGTANHAAICTRMMMLGAATAIEYGEVITNVQIPQDNQDYVGAHLRSWAHTYTYCKSHLPSDNVRSAFEGMFLWYIEWLIPQGARNVNTNMDTRAVAAGAYLSETASKQIVVAKSDSLARRWLFGCTTCEPKDAPDISKAIWHHVGCIGELDGCDFSYGGISSNSLYDAAMIKLGDPTWARLDTVVATMLRFRAHTVFHESSGPLNNTRFQVGEYYDGPSSPNKRLADPFVYEQSSTASKWIAAAMIDSLGRMLLYSQDRDNPGETNAFADSAAMHARVNAVVNETNGARAEGVPGATAITAVNTIAPLAFDVNGDSGPFPELSGLTYANWNTATIDNIVSRYNAKEVDTQYPCDPTRDININTRFDDWYWFVRDSTTSGTEFCYLIETIDDEGSGYQDGAQLGGSLQALWVEGAGIVSLTRHNKFDDAEADWDSVAVYATNHMWGFTSTGERFSSAHEDAGARTVTYYGSTEAWDSVRVAVDFPIDGAWSDTPISTRTISRDAGVGFTIEASYTSGSDLIDELWENLPVFEYDVGSQDDTAIGLDIDLCVSSSWVQSTTSSQSATAIRIMRYGTAVYFDIGAARGVRLHDREWVTNHQNDATLQNVRIDLHPNSGTSTAVTSAQVRYSFVTTDPC